MDELKPCPFCGGEAVNKQDGEPIYCGSCYSSMPYGICEKDMISLWNARAPQSEWISVDEPPEIYQRVLILTTNSDGDPWVMIAHYNGLKSGYLLTGGHKDKDVIGWMPLPASSKQ